jgi:prepilin-type N-terminal cleavage/methylation domain-containing protein
MVQRRQALRHGFTLIEVLLVIVILVVLLALAWPSLVSTERAEHLPESATRIRALAAMCRAQAMAGACRYRLRFHADGTIDLRRQRDAIEAPHEYVKIDESWGKTVILVEGVWVESLLRLPQGPPPILVEDESIQFTQLEEGLVRVEGLEQPVDLFFEPDGSSASMRWVLRDEIGRGLQMTLDGRLGRVDDEPIAAVAIANLARPKPVEHRDEEEGKL